MDIPVVPIPVPIVTTDPLNPVVPPTPPQAALTRVFRTVNENGPNGKRVFQYFTAAAIGTIGAEIFLNATLAQQNFGVTSFPADVTAVDLTAFLAAGGMLIGPVELK